jgi:SEC-C motif-containing protein
MGRQAQSPEALMRSRYSAYALALVEYIIDTTHPDSPQAESDRAAWRRSIEHFCRTTRFAGLTILAVDDDKVTFRASLFVGPDDVSFTERSLFRRSEGRWLYVSGLATQ